MTKICLDAGHYGKYNQSPANKAYYESDMNWKLHNLLKKYLKQYGFEVIQTRSNQATDLALTSRGKLAKGCDLFLSIHSNAVGSGVNESIDYPVAYVPLNGSGDKIGKLLADCVAKTMGTKQAGRYESRKGSTGQDYYGVIRGAVSVGVPGIILEHSFHTNTKMTNWLLVDANLEKMAKAEAAVIAKHFSVEKPEEDADASVLYRVRKAWADSNSQKGAYRSLAYAKECADKNPGYSVFDESGNAVYPDSFKAYEVKITASALNVRKGAGTSYKVVTAVKRGEVFTIVDEENGWGKLKSGVGWISLKYTVKC